MSKLVPKLRFNGFSGDWKDKQLKDICNMQAGKFISASEIYENHVKNTYPCFGGNGLRGYTKSYTHQGNYPLIGRQGELCGNINLAIGQFYATEHAVVSKVKEQIDTFWLYYSLINLKLNQYATGQAQPGLSVKVLEKVKVIVPKSEQEQQKIANCLSSLDNLMEAQNKKVEALKKHKKGLMQQLFPKDGEKEPKIRFNGFSGEWEEKKIDDLANRYDNLRIPITASYRVKGTTPYYGANGIQDYVEGYTHDGEFILLAEDGANDLKNYPVQYVNGKIWVNNHAHVLQAKENVSNNIFLMYVIKNINIEPYLVGGGRAKLNANIMMKISCLIPKPKEQEKIANCLSSLDNLIETQSKKIEALKEHKKGLMQQLFVSSEEN